MAVFSFLTNYVFANGQLPITIRTDGYSATLAENGYLSSIIVDGSEFISKADNIPGGFYLCAGRIPPATLVSIDGNCYNVTNDIASLTYVFDDNKITVRISNIQKKGSLYVLLNMTIKEVRYMPGVGQAPILEETPVNARCRKTRWYAGDSVLDIAGSSRIWGPWHNHQVVDIELIPGVTNTITFVPGRRTTLSELQRCPDVSFDYDNTTTPRQIPLCMIGDSITWAEKGDFWRKYLLENLPRLAFVGYHSAVLGYSHAGEGGNNTEQVLKRVKNIPVSPYYSLLIGTNDNAHKNKDQITAKAKNTAGNILKIVKKLLDRPATKKIFLCSILPCYTGNPIRNDTNRETNKILRKMLKRETMDPRIIWVEMEKPLLATENWQELIKLHPTKEGYKIIAKILATSIAETLNINDDKKLIIPEQKSETGVRIINLIDGKQKQTYQPLIAGWYTLSFQLNSKVGDNPKVIIKNSIPVADLYQEYNLSDKTVGKRVSFNFFTGYEGYGYTRAVSVIDENNCEVSNVLLEKKRPSGKMSFFNTKTSYIDKITKPALGELIEF